MSGGDNRIRHAQALAADPGEPHVRPGWLEMGCGLLAMLAVAIGLGSQLARLGMASATFGLVLTGWSGVAGLAGFAAAWLVRRPALAALGVCATSRRWLLIGLGAGVAAFVAKGLTVMLYTAVTGIDSNPQGVFASGGREIWAVVLATLLLGVFTPIGEEFLFRGVMANALLRYGALVGVVGSALVFALLHGISVVFPAALLLGLVAGELFRRSGSVWPPMVAHVVYNLPTVPVLLLVGGH